MKTESGITAHRETPSRVPGIEKLNGSSVGQLLKIVDQDDPWNEDSSTLASLRLEAIRQRFAEHREQIPALRQRANTVGVNEISSIEDLVPLLFAHTTYKSYPESFLTDAKWDRLLMWLKTVTATQLNVALDDVNSVDDFIEAVEASGVHLSFSSGTDSKVSFLAESSDDYERAAYLSARLFGWPGTPVSLTNDYIYFNMITSHNHHSDAGRRDYLAVPGETYRFDSIRLDDISSLTALRRRIASSDALPQEIVDYERNVAERSARVNARAEELVRLLDTHRTDPILVTGAWNLAWRVVEAAQAMGVAGGGFSSASLMQLGGGAKGATMPATYKEDILAWFNGVQLRQIYGMIEISSGARMCEARRYHPAPWIQLLMLDESGTHFMPLDEEGTTTGRVAYFDCLFDGRWGGIVSGDHATARFGQCLCGRPGPTIDDSIMRYSELTGAADTKLTCSAAVDSYIRGIVS
jgi:hypothetical protein